MKKVLSALLTLALLATMAVGFSSVALAEGEDITIEFFYSPWATTPHDGYDPYEEYVEEKYGADFILTPATDFETQLITRASADDTPDLILFGNATQLNSVYAQGVLVDDWTPYLENMPATVANMSDLARAFLTVDGKIIACPAQAGDQKWSFMVRKDWMETLGLSMPTTDAEFLDMLHAFTFDDPDGNGENDTYGFTSAGGNSGVGELRNLLLLYSCGNYYINEEGAVDYFVTDGSFLEYLKLARTIVSEGLIDPDWYTQGWDERKPALYAGEYGFCWYPANALLQETNEMYNDDGATAMSMWDMVPMWTGNLNPEPICGALRSASAKAAEDEAKMDIICQYLENGAYPNEDFFILRMGYKIDGYDVMKTLDDGTIFLGTTDPNFTDNRKMLSGSIMFGWGQMIQAQGASVISSDVSDSPTEFNEVKAAYGTQWQNMSHWDGSYLMLNLDPTLTADSNNYIAEFEIDFILGNKTEDDYEAFMNTWLDQYGEELMDAATETFEAYGLLTK